MNVEGGGDECRRGGVMNVEGGVTNVEGTNLKLF